jgi:hypothetical protein
VCKHIVEETNKVTNLKQNIVNYSIKLTIYSPECPNITIINLPDITKVDIGDQIDVYKITSEIAEHYCKD